MNFELRNAVEANFCHSEYNEESTSNRKQNENLPLIQMRAK